MSGGKPSGRQTLPETGSLFPRKLQPPPGSQSVDSSDRPDALPQERKLGSPLLVLASTFPRGKGDSTPAFVLDLSKHLQSRFQVTVLTPTVRGAADRDEIDGVQVRRFRYFWPRALELLADGAILENVRRGRWLLLLAPFLFLFEFISAFRWASTNRPSVLHAHWFVPQGLVAVMVGGLLRIPVVVTSHGGDIYGLRGRFWTYLRKAVAWRCAAVTVVSQDMVANLPGLRSGNGEAPKVMPMGVDTSRFHPARRDGAVRKRLSIRGPFILFVGRLAEKKGVPYLLEAMADVLRDFSDSTLVIVGDGPLRGQLETLAGELGISRNVRFVGGLGHEELPAYYATADIFVGPSIVARGGDTESFGVVFAEAMASGCPVIASGVGGTSSIVIDGKTGLLVEEKSPAALADALRKLLRDKALRKRLQTAGPPWIRERFDQRVVADRYARLLLEVTSVER